MTDATSTSGLYNSSDAILAASPDCIKVLSREGILKFINRNGLLLLEAESAGQLCGKFYPDLWPSEMRQQVMDAIVAAAEGHGSSFEGYCPTLNGNPRWWETHFSRVAGAGAHATEVICVTRDISVRRARELMLRANEERFARLIDSASDGICETASDGRCSFMNSSGAHMLGYRSEELIGKSLHEMIHHHHSDGTPYAWSDSPVFKATLSSSPKRVADEVFWHKDGRAVAVSYCAYPISKKGGVVVTFSDRTESKQVESDMRRMASQLSDAERRTTEFIATLAHELRNPLAPIRTGLQLMSKAGDDAAAVASVRQMMERQLGQMVHLISDLLDIARITSGKIELKKSHIQLGKVIESAVEASSLLISRANHSLHVDISQEPFCIDGDATRLAQVFTNLLDNAAKYTAAGGSISIVAARSGDDVVIDISDSGIGIAPEALLPIFEMFTKIGHEVRGVQGGLGIGLNLVRRLVQLHGGEVVATSEGIGKGSHFLVSLPLATAGERDADALVKVSHRHAAEHVPVKVLLVDDNADAAASLSMLLQLGDHVTRVANSGAEALSLVGEFRPDIIFLDIGMPEMNGYEVARAIRQMPEAGSPVLVALTGWGGESDRLMSKDAGFDEHLTKPADISVIEQLLAKFDQDD